jgi:hypothetical protein
MLSAIMLSVIMLSVIMLSVIMLSVIMLSVIMLNVETPVGHLKPFGPSLIFLSSLWTTRGASLTSDYGGMIETNTLAYSVAAAVAN